MAEGPTRLLDTSIFVDYLRGNETCKVWLGNSALNDMAYSIVTAAELLAGCRNRREQDLVERELAIYPMIQISGAISLPPGNGIVNITRVTASVFSIV